MNRRSFLKTALSGSAAAGFLTVSYSPTQAASRANPEPGYVQQVREGVLAFLEEIRYKEEGWGRWPYNKHMMRPYGLTSSAEAIKTLTTYDALRLVPESQRREAIAFIHACQDPRDDYFKDPLVKPSDKHSDHHSWEHIWAHMSSNALSALALLGAEPLRLKASAPFGADLTVIDPEEWVTSQDWSNPWMIGEHMTRVVSAYVEKLPPDQRTPEEPRVKRLLDTYEKLVIDPQTGMPTKGGCTSRSRAMAGLFKSTGSYQRVGREVPYADRAIDFVLDLQLPDGSFGEEIGAVPMTLNWDSVWVLRELNKQLGNGHRFNDIRAAGNELAAFLLAHHRKPDGGFSFHRDYCNWEHNSIRTSDKLPEGDTHGTEMCLRCLAYADEWNATS